jgi:hypothetical protein
MDGLGRCDSRRNRASAQAAPVEPLAKPQQRFVSTKLFANSTSGNGET